MPLRQQAISQKSRVVTFLLVFYICLLLCVVLISCNKENGAYKIRQIIKTGNFEVKILSVRILNRVGTFASDKRAGKGRAFICVCYQFKNISDKPVRLFPEIVLINSEKTEYYPDVTASAYYAHQFMIETGSLAEVKPGVTVKDAGVFEVTGKTWNRSGWKLKMSESDKDYYIIIKYRPDMK